MKSQVKYGTQLDIFMYDRFTKEELKINLFLHPMQVRTLYRQPYFIPQLKNYLLKKIDKTSDEVEVFTKINVVLNMHKPSYVIDTAYDISSLQVNKLGRNQFIRELSKY